MIYTTKCFGQEMNSFVPLRRKRDEQQRASFPVTMPGDYVQARLHPSGNYDFGSWVGITKAKTIRQPCSVDITIDSFSDADGNALKFPIILEPYAKVIGHCGLEYYWSKGELLCLETKSRMARKGFFVTGFLNKYLSSTASEPFKWNTGDLDFVLKNFNHFPVKISKPFMPVQVSVVRSLGAYPRHNRQVRLMRDNSDVTEDNIISIGRFIAYYTTLKDELVYYSDPPGPVEITDDSIAKFMVRDGIDAIYKKNPGFCLTRTQEEVHTNGCPAYMYPFHYRDAIENEELLENTDSLAKFVQMAFDENHLNSMPVTGNAGMLNPGTNVPVVCENACLRKDLKKYFRVNEPFALVIPVPFSGGKLDTTSYNGTHGNQDAIGL